MRARSAAALALLVLTAPPPAASQPEQPSPPPAAPDRVVEVSDIVYAIHASLDPASRTITGDQILTWRNATAHTASTLQFHLYYNAWRNTESTWMRGRRLAGDTTLARRPESDWGWIDITSLRVMRSAGDPDAIDLSRRMRFIAPDDGNTEDRTVAEVPLDQPVQPGETVQIGISWSSRVPRPFARTGVVGNAYFLGHWFPKIGVLRDDGWHTRQFHATTEFFSEFASYGVHLEVPAGWVVGATGTERGRREGPGGTTIHDYFQDQVHDFAWTTSPDYLELTDTFTHPTLPPVTLRLLLQPEHRGQEARIVDATRAALAHFGEWFGPYPYGHLTIVDPGWQSDAGGMEYPTLFTTRTRWLAPRRALQPESVTIHETGHQFWYGIVATNEVDHAWMDEGLTTFATTRLLAERFDPNYAVARYFGGFVPWVFRDLPLSRDTETRSAGLYRATMARGDPLAVPAWRHWPGSVAGTTYHKTALWLHTLERMLGWETLQRILSTYFDRYAFRHPEPDDFFRVATEISGQDLSWFFDQVYRGSSRFDYGIDLFRSEPVVVRGYRGHAPPHTFTDTTLPDTYRTTVVVRRHGDGIFPVDVRIVFADGEEIRWRWDGRERWKLFEIERPVPAVRADVDPDRVLLLDVHVTNNSATVRPAGPRAARKWSLVWLIWLQDHLLTYGFFV